MNKHLTWACTIQNIIVALAWIVLAVACDTWWIALFSLLSMCSVETRHRYYRVCDRCNKHSEYADSHNKALDKAKAAGWLHVSEGNKDYCPDCRREINK